MSSVDEQYHGAVGNVSNANDHKEVGEGVPVLFVLAGKLHQNRAVCVLL